ncbi:hypothetical protein [Corallococcus exiguus]|uniref:hypothetical protein n=1 Tax=Corallococcus exiguus TaxID=83462 RepID=UPI002152BBB5|nr:hypothetical protein [Corallococcus exiguus]
MPAASWHDPGALLQITPAHASYPYTSAVARLALPVPPTTKIFPSSGAATCTYLAPPIGVVALHVPLASSYSSALLNALPF